MTEEEQVAEDEAAVAEQKGQTVITVPEALLPAIRQLLADSSTTYESGVMNDSARYIKIVEWSDVGQCFIGQRPRVVGPCCHGDNEAVVYAELCEIVEECLEIFRHDGKPLPPATAGQGVAEKIF
jgi:hypothetical protein